MKKIIIFLFITLISVGIVAFANTKISSAENNVETVDNILVFKQNLYSANDTISIYYVKSLNGYKVYSETNLNKQSPNKLKTIIKTDIKIVDNYKGDCYVTCNNLNEVYKLFKSLYGKYNNYINDNIDISFNFQL